VALGQLERRDEQVLGWRRLLAAYDVDRQLERGYSLTMRADGTLVRNAADVAGGDSIVTRLADGAVLSTVETVESTESKEPRGSRRDDVRAAETDEGLDGGRDAG
jgi:exonuclease VII large subunit